MIFSNAFPIKVHTWGGLGSQLYGVIVASRIKSRYPSRDTKIIFHSSGLTRRSLEIDVCNTIKVPFSYIDDWEPYTFPNQRMPNIKSRSLQFAKTCLVRLRFVIKPSRDEDLDRLKPWTFSVRGDYSRITISKTEIELVSSLLNLESRYDSAHSKSQETVVHFRSDDLVTKKPSAYTSPSTINTILERKAKANVIVYTDGDIEEVQKEFEKPGRRIECRKSTTRNVISHSVTARIFIGTGSKVSLWIGILRAHHGIKRTFLPKSLFEAAKCNLGRFQTEEIEFY